MFKAEREVRSRGLGGAVLRRRARGFVVPVAEHHDGFAM